MDFWGSSFTDDFTGFLSRAGAAGLDETAEPVFTAGFF
jgi:hypothetical protein